MKKHRKTILCRFNSEGFLEGWPESHEKCPDSIKDFYPFHYELSVIDGLVLKGPIESLFAKC